MTEINTTENIYNHQELVQHISIQYLLYCYYIRLHYPQLNSVHDRFRLVLVKYAYNIITEVDEALNIVVVFFLLNIHKQYFELGIIYT